jgi:hypothetical protein
LYIAQSSSDKSIDRIAKHALGWMNSGAAIHSGNASFKALGLQSPSSQIRFVKVIVDKLANKPDAEKLSIKSGMPQKNGRSGRTKKEKAWNWRRGKRGARTGARAVG